MMVTAQGADHTAGNLPRLKTRPMDLETLMELSLKHQVKVAANDSLGLCVFGQSVTNTNLDFLTDAINAAHGTTLTPSLLRGTGRGDAALRGEFNRQAGFTAADDDLPEFFYQEPLPPTNHVARFRGEQVQSKARFQICPLAWWRIFAASTPGGATCPRRLCHR
jgi:aldehyde:ferredoxin oxidoreductase